MRKTLFAAAWVVGILFPMAWFSQNHPTLQIWFDRAFSATWMHIVMHAFLYAVLAAVLWICFARSRHRWLLVIGLVLCVGVLQEGLQLIPSGRLPGWGEMFDWSVDLTGSLIGILLASLWRNAPRLRRL